MNYRQIASLIMVVGCTLVGSACSKTNFTTIPAPAAALVEKQNDGTRLLCFVDNVEVNEFTQSKFGPNDIKSINVLRPSATNNLVDTYGPKAKNGVILVTTKNGR